MIIAGYDCETTGLLDPDHRIIEACVQLWEYDAASGTARKISSDTWRCKPGRRIDPKALAVHGITNDMLEKEPAWEEVAPKMMAVLNKCQIAVAHNGNEFDWPFLIQELERINHPLPEFDVIDTMLDGRWATPLGKVPNLSELCFACDVDYDPSQAHAAEYDVEVLMTAFFNGLKLGGFQLPS